MFIAGSICVAGQPPNEPAKALQDYFKALRTSDKDLLQDSIQATDEFKKQFLRVIDVAQRLRILDGLLAKKYGIPDEKRHDINQYLVTLSAGSKNREIKVSGDKAETVPGPSEVPVFFVKVGGAWKLDLDRGQAPESLALQAKSLRAVYDSTIPLLNGLIEKIDTLNTNKFTYEEAWEMVAIQMQRKVSAVTEKASEPTGAASPGPPHR
jgi:hypothetical protein